MTSEDILNALRVVHDPEIPVNVVDLGLVYEAEISEGRVDVKMTLTSMGCPVMDQLKQDAELAILGVPGVQEAHVEFVWSPAWNKDMVTEQGKRMLRMYGYPV
ncbi:MAG: metal-sulfur cluster assembly factor [Deinococcus sp.]|nr:metal-sulfur cluster assembly factor [Deinococcus sp.]